MYYIISIGGYEAYSPHWFGCDCSKEEFDKIVRDSIGKAVDELIEKEPDDFIDGYDLMQYLLPILEKQGFVGIKKDHEIDIGGECLYSEQGREEIFSDDIWRKILKQNAKVHDDMHDDTMNQIAEQEVKKSRFQKVMEKIRNWIREVLYKIAGRL